MTIHATLLKLPVSLSQCQWSRIVDTRSVPSLLVPSPLDRVLYAEAGWPAYLLEIQTSRYSENRCQSVLWQRIIPVIGESFPPGGSHFHLRRQWPGSHSRRGVIHASDSGTTSSSVVLVVSPLVSLMADQVSSLRKRGVKAAILGGHAGVAKELQVTVNDLRSCDFSLLFSSPEAIAVAENWRQKLLTPPLSSRVVAIAVDEAHCVSKW